MGKTTIARIFSKSLNCEEGQGANPCGQCNTCKEIEQGNYVDLLEIDAASRTKVEDTRELLDNVQYKPTRGRYKVYLIDEVHMLSKHSFNALLKTLEEPPPHVKFLLATTDPQKLPITILSRCLQFNLKAMSREQIVGQLTHILEHEALPFEPQALALLARAAQGSMRDALSLTDQAIAQGGNQVLASVVTDMLGLMDKNQLLKVVHGVVSKSAGDVLELVNVIAQQAPDYDNVLSELASILHQVALTQWVPEACKLETTSAKAIYQLAKTIPAEQVQLLYQIALQGRKDLPFASDGKSAFEMTLMRMMTFAPAPSVDNTHHIIEQQAHGQNTPLSQSGEAAHQPSQTPASMGNNELYVEGGGVGSGEGIDAHHNPSGGPGNVSKQKETPLSETSATSTTAQSNDTKSSGDPSDLAVNGTSSANTDASVELDPQPHLASVPDTLKQHEAVSDKAEAISDKAEAISDKTQAVSEKSDAVSARQNAVSDISDDAPPLSAYMDDMPPVSEDDTYGVDYGDPGNFTPFGREPSAEKEPSADQEPSAEKEPSAQQAPSPEAQLTSTADLLALRQKLKQRKAQESDEASASSKADKSQSAADIQSRFVKPSPLSTVDGENSPERDNSPERENSPEPTNRPASTQSTVSTDTLQVEASANQNSEQQKASLFESEADSQQPINATVSSKSDELPYNSESDGGNASAPESEFTFDGEFDEDMPYASDTVESTTDPVPMHSQTAANPLGTSSGESQLGTSVQDEGATANTSEFDQPPWETDNTFSQNGDSPLPSPESESSIEDGATYELSPFDTPLSASYNGHLKAYLNDGSKLTHASQIDEWSHLVEQMPVAGLLKQLVLHAAFSRNGDTVSLEIDHSQSHLLNDSARKQLVDAMHHGLGENVNVEITLGQPASTPFALQQEIQAMRHAHAHTVINTDDTIQTLLSTFEASVITDTVKAR